MLLHSAVNTGLSLIYVTDESIDPSGPGNTDSDRLTPLSKPREKARQKRQMLNFQLH